MSETLSYHRPVARWAKPLFQILFICALIIVTYKSVQPSLSTSISIPNLDKILHAITYFILTVSFGLAAPKLRLVYVILVPILFGGLMEILQGLTAMGRTADILDMLANMTGAITAVMLWSLSVKLFNRVKRAATAKSSCETI